MKHLSKIQSFILLGIIVHGLAIARIPVNEGIRLQSGETDLATQLHDRYQPLRNLLDAKQTVGHMVTLKDGAGLQTARRQVLRYTLAPRPFTELRGPAAGAAMRNQVLRDLQEIDILIYEGKPDAGIFEIYPVSVHVNPDLHILKK